MASSNSVPGFTASVDGLHFINSWPSEPDIVIDAGPLGKVPIGDASNGLCGGMVYTVIDVFTASLPPIPDTQQPRTARHCSTTSFRDCSRVSTSRPASSPTTSG